jgi:hypothetical protein
VKVAGDASSLTITTMHDIGNTFDPLFASSDLVGISGLNFAVVDDQVTPQAAMASRAMSVSPGERLKKILSIFFNLIECSKYFNSCMCQLYNLIM